MLSKNLGKLNKVLLKNKTQKKKMFFCGNHFFKAVELLNKRFPYSKVLLVCSPETFLTKGSRFISVLSALEMKCDYVKIEKAQLMDKKVCNAIFDKLDAVRAIVFFEDYLLDALKYVGSASNLPIFFSYNGINFSGAFDSVAYLNDNGVLNSYATDAETYLILDDKSYFEENIKTAFSNLACHLTDIIDLSVYLKINDQKINQKHVDLLFSATNALKEIYKADKVSGYYNLVYGLLIIETLNNALNGLIFNQNFARTTKILAKKLFNQELSADNLFSLSESLIKIYALALKNGAVDFSTKNNLAHLKTLQDKVNFSQTEFLEKIKKDQDNYNRFISLLINSKQNNKKFVKILNNQKATLTAVSSIYFSLGGKIAFTKKQLKALNLSQYFNKFSGLSIISQKGFLEIFN